MTVLVEKLPDPEDENGFIASSTVSYMDEAGEKSNGIFVNETKPGNLQIAKSVKGASEAAEEQTFTLRLRLESRDYLPVSGSWPAVRTAADGKETEETVTTNENGVAELKIRDGETILVKDLPDGTRYTVEETDIPSAWKQTGSEGTEGKIVSTETAEVSFENTYSMKGKAALRAEKRLDVGAPAEEEYGFQLVDRTEGSETYGQVIETVRNRAADEESGSAPVTFTALEYTGEGTWNYGIREMIPTEEDEGYDPKMAYDSREIRATVTMKDLSGGGTLTATVTYAGGEGEGKNGFLNTFKPGSLKISKTIQDATEVSETQEFTVEAGLKDRDGNALEGTFDAVRTDGDGKETKETVTVKGGKCAVVLKGGETLLINGLPYGAAWELTEQGADGWVQTEAEGTAGTVEADKTAEASFVNTYSAKGQVVLEARKTMDPAEIPMPAELFSFILRDEKGGELQRTKNDPDGKGIFQPIVYDQADAG